MCRPSSVRVVKPQSAVVVVECLKKSKVVLSAFIFLFLRVH